MSGQLQFTPADYGLFATTLAISAGIGIFYAVRTRMRQRETTDEFLMAGRSMRAVPVALSVLASFFSASTLLGTPAEIYLRGTQYWMAVWGAVIAPLTGAFVFGPFFHQLKVVSVYEYLERRFRSRVVRLLGAIIFIIRTSLGMGIVLYGPAVALNAVTGFPVEAVIAIIGGVCTLYTSIGGLKAVIWTDVFQTLIMLVGMLAVIIRGVMSVGGLAEMWRISYDGGRIQFFDFNPDPTVRHTFWSLVVGSYLLWLMPYSVDQQMVQRFSSARSLRDAKIALLLNIPGMAVIITLCCLCGLVMYANYASCDPLRSGRIRNSNQLLPYFVLDRLGDLQGLPGIFIAALFSGALSSVSSMLNSLAAVTWEDFLKSRFRHVSESRAAIINKILAFGFGVLGIILAILVSRLPGTVLQLSITFNGSSGAPLLGIFVLAAFFPFANVPGAIMGGILGFAFPMWLSLGKYIEKIPTSNLHTSVAGCPENNVTDMTSAATLWMTQVATTGAPPTTGGLHRLYSLSYLWLGGIGTVTTVVVGVIVSLLTGPRDPSDVEPELLMSYVDACWCCLPESWRVKCRCVKRPQDTELHEHVEGTKSNGSYVIYDAYIGDAKTEGYLAKRDEDTHL